MGLYEHRAVNHLNVLHIISWCLLSLGAEPRWDECHYSVEAPGCDAPFVCRGNEAWLCRDGGSSLNCYRRCSPDSTVTSCFCHPAKCTAFYCGWAGKVGAPSSCYFFHGQTHQDKVSEQLRALCVCVPWKLETKPPSQERKALYSTLE